MRVLLFVASVWGLLSFLQRKRREQRPRRRLTAAGRHRTSPPNVVYQIVEHDGGWAYKVGDVFSESHPTRREALIAAQNAAAAHELRGEDARIEYQDEDGLWHDAVASGGDRPHAEVEEDRDNAGNSP